ncbi:MAG: response regulator [Acidobacteriota bacterium]|nr:response regulator [Acidobacteriota bacterium]
MAKPGGSFKERLKALRDEYRQLLPVKIKEIENTWHLSWQIPDKRDGMLDMIYRQTHSLAGSGTTFGFSEVSAVASEMESFIKTVQQDGQALEPKHDAAVDRFLTRMRRAAGEPEEPYDIDEVPEAETRQTWVRRQTLYWLGLDDALTEEVLNQLPIFGFKVTGFKTLQDLIDATKYRMPEVVVFDLAAPEGPFPETGTVFEFLGTLSEKARIVCILPPETDLSGRLAAIRSGAGSCLLKPVVFDELLGRLDKLSPAHIEPPFRLFIIDDDSSLTANTAAIMSRAGMVVESINDPLQALEPLIAFEPDLILLDLHMPQCNGIELARIISQDERFFGVAIVYLSQEKELNHQLEALEAGAEDFILKPVKYRYLYHSLACRMRRARQQRLQRTHDGLTGLLNHTSFHIELRNRIARATKEGNGFVLALLDPDNFSEINETHGHVVGDRVLHTLALMLRRGFGSKVTLARYGSNTIALILPHAGATRADDILERLRSEFARIRHRGNTGSFSVTLSKGIAEFPRFANSTDLIGAAEKALDEAGGRTVEKMDVLQPMPTPTETLPATADSEEPQFIDEEDYDTLDEPILDAGDDRIPIRREEGMQDDLFMEDRTVVVVDDDRQVLGVIVSFLESQGFVVHGAVTGDEGYELAKQHKPDLMLIDLLLFPGIHGFELCKMVKENKSLEGVKIILMTAVYKDYRYRVEGREAGGDAFIIKPINFDQLMEKIESLTRVAPEA